MKLAKPIKLAIIYVVKEYHHTILPSDTSVLHLQVLMVLVAYFQDKLTLTISACL